MKSAYLCAKMNIQSWLETRNICMRKKSLLPTVWGSDRLEYRDKLLIKNMQSVAASASLSSFNRFSFFLPLRAVNSASSAESESKILQAAWNQKWRSTRDRKSTRTPTKDSKKTRGKREFCQVMRQGFLCFWQQVHSRKFVELYRAPPFTHIKPSRAWIISNLRWQVHWKFDCFNQNCSIQKAFGAQIELWSKKLIDQWTESAQKIIFPVASVYGFQKFWFGLFFAAENLILETFGLSENRIAHKLSKREFLSKK